jgi:hypothetical protein
MFLRSLPYPSRRMNARATERRRACCYLCSSADRYRRFGGTRCFHPPAWHDVPIDHQ